MSKALNVVLYWHMHQPEYRDLRNNEYHLPWTYLHTTKDYVDMAAHLEDNPKARAVVNFAPVLLEQIEDYSQQLKGYLHHGKALRDPLLAALAEPVISKDQGSRSKLIRDCLRANEDRLINRFPPFKKLADMSKIGLDNMDMLSYYDEQFLADLLVWYHLAWMAETVRRKDARIKNLMKKARLFTVHDRQILVEIIYELVSTVIGRYKKLAEAGQIELSMTPYAHPIVPLLLDINSAREAMPEAHLPIATHYPDGEARSRWHMEKGVETFKKHFGFLPQGCWPSEGSISGATVDLMSDMGVRWLASGETVLKSSLHKSGEPTEQTHHPFYYAKNKTACFFRDDGLSDLIGFKYSDWHADDAVNDLVTHLEAIAEANKEAPEAIVSIILDGENAWEYYPENGYYFLSTLYARLAEHTGVELTTYSQYLDRYPDGKQLKEIVAGSWVYGSFSTWIGEEDKNRAWDMLVDAKRAYDEVIGSKTFSAKEIENIEYQLATCESSDWFWWFGAYNSSDSVTAFDEQYRMHLSNLYHLLDKEPPEYLAHAFSFGSGAPAMGGAMLPGQQ